MKESPSNDFISYIVYRFCRIFGLFLTTINRYVHSRDDKKQEAVRSVNEMLAPKQFSDAKLQVQ